MKEFIKRLIPNSALEFYHKALSYLAAFYYGYPSKELIIIGVTGTNGKSSVVNILGRILEEAGFKVGLTSTVNFKIRDHDRLNPTKMTMPGRFLLQKMLKRMVRAGCQYAIIESSSEGVLQYRHLNIHYDVMVLTNLTPEHLERHGGFENYKNAKLEYFRLLEKIPIKTILGNLVPKTIIVNADSEYANEFLSFSVTKKLAFSIHSANTPLPGVARVYKAEHPNTMQDGSVFNVDGVTFKIYLKGRVNIENALAAITTARSQGVSLDICQKAFIKIRQIPGRFEFIEEGQDFKVLVDYAPEPYALQALYDTVSHWNHKRIIQVLGSAGGGRDKSRRQILGEMAGKFADLVVVTNEDPYDEDPWVIVDGVACGAERVGKLPGQNLFRILDRREAIKKSLQLAESGDLVLITGKGSEQAIVVKGGRKIPWDDRRVVSEELKSLVSATKK